MEIERKFLLNKQPENLEQYPHYGIEQAYILTQPVIRVRKKTSYQTGSLIPSDISYILTVKGSGMLAREEFELPLDASAYEKLCQKAEGNIITKTRYLLPLPEGLTMELDVFANTFEGLVMAEIEFPDEQTANSYALPAFVKSEVTFDTRFHNSTMSHMTSGEIQSFLKSLS